MSTIDLEQAKQILGDDLLGPAEVRSGFGEDAGGALGSSAPAIPFDTATLRAAAAEGCFLVFRVARGASGPLTIMRLGEIAPDGLDPSGHTGVGYALRDEWTLEGQPFATNDTVETGWALVRKRPLPTTVNKTRVLQDAVLAALPPSTRPARRSAVEIVYDTLLWHRVRGERLLADAWDWSRSASTDAGHAAVGEFGPKGLRIIAYSGAVRFGTLGVCAQR